MYCTVSLRVSRVSKGTVLYVAFYAKAHKNGDLSKSM